MPSVHPDLTALVNRRLAELGYAGRRLSYRGAAARAEEHGSSISPETIRQMANGSHTGRIEDSTVEALRHALGVSRARVLEAMHEQRATPLGEWQPPPLATRLTLRQRRAIEQLIAAMVVPSSAADDDIPNVDLVAVGDQGLLVVHPEGDGPISENDRATNEQLADEKLDQMEKDSRSRRRFGGR